VKNYIKQMMVGLFRKLHLLQYADNIKLVIELCKTAKVNKHFKSRYPDFILPPYSLAFDAYGHTNWKGYYETGLEDAKMLSKIIQKYVSGENIKIGEWGCGPARILRHMPSLLKDYKSVNLYGFDYNSDSIDWCKKYVKRVNFIKNNLTPPLLMNSDYLDCLYNVSVFTHLSKEMHFSWINELSRIVRPGGVIILTTHGDLCRFKLLGYEKEKYDKGELVIRGNIKEGKKCFVAYHPPIFMRNELLKDFHIVRHITDLFYQDIWVIQNN